MSGTVGSWLRRFRHRFQRRLGAWATHAAATIETPAYRTMYRFETPESVETWSVVTDDVAGGFSTASFEFEPAAKNKRPCGLFRGNISTKTSGEMIRSGFAAVRIVEDGPMEELHLFEALEIVLRTDGRPYTFNVKCEHLVEHLYQARVWVPPNRWATVALPFRDLTLTHRGTVVPVAAPVDQSTISGIGLLLADGQGGPFEARIASVRALRDFDSRQTSRVPKAVVEEIQEAEEAQEAQDEVRRKARA